MLLSYQKKLPVLPIPPVYEQSNEENQAKLDFIEP